MAGQSSWVLSPFLSPPRGSPSQQSLLLFQHVCLLGQCTFSGPGRGPPSCNSFGIPVAGTGYERGEAKSKTALRLWAEPLLRGREWDGEDASAVYLWGQNQEVSLGSRQRGALGAMETVNKPALRWS